MTDPSMPDPDRLVTLGVDTHLDTHVAAVLDERGVLLDSMTLPTTPAGYQALLDWAAEFARSIASGSRAPAAMAPAWRAGCVAPAWWCSRSTAPTDVRAASTASEPRAAVV